MVWVLLPVKDLVRAKSRLSGILAPHERRGLAQAMAEDVLAVVTRAEGVEGVLLVSDDPAAGLLAHKYAVDVLSEADLGCTGLNPVIEAATDYLKSRAAEHVMVMHADLPLVQPGDIQSLLAAYADESVGAVIVPDLDGTGTNVMMFAAAQSPAFQYGPGSCQRHQQEFAAMGSSCHLLHNARLGLDVDEPGDLLHLFHSLQSGERGGHSADVLLDAGVAQRLSLIERAGLDPLMEAEQHDAV